MNSVRPEKKLYAVFARVRRRTGMCLLLCVLAALLFPALCIGEENTDFIDPETLVLADTSDPFRVGGHLRLFFLSFAADEFGSTTAAAERREAALLRLRVSPEARPSSDLFIRGDFDAAGFTLEGADAPTLERLFFGDDFNDFFQPRSTGGIGEDAGYRLNVHRLYAKLTSGPFTVTAGRQQVRFGSGKLWNPLDILNPISPFGVEGGEDQKGTDAIRVEYYPTLSTEAALVYAPKREDDEFDLSALANDNTQIVGRLRVTVREADVAVLAGRVAQRELYGVDASGIFRDGLLRGALLYSQPEDEAGWFSANAGWEYAFPGGLNLLVEYFFNQSSLYENPDVARALENALSFGLDETGYPALANRFLTQNRHYAGLDLGMDITPLVRAGLFLIADFEGSGLFINPSVTWNFAQNADFAVSAAFAATDGDGRPSDFDGFADHPRIIVTLSAYF